MKSAITEYEKSENDPTDKNVQKIIQKLIKQHVESKEAFDAAGRLNDEDFFIETLSSFLPSKIPDDRLKIIVDEEVYLIGSEKKNMGTIIKSVIQRVQEEGFLADGSEVSRLVKEKLT